MKIFFKLVHRFNIKRKKLNFKRRDIDRQNRAQAVKDYAKRARLGVDKLPSICFYTILNSYNT
jgi:hypothetical protein